MYAFNKQLAGQLEELPCYFPRLTDESLKKNPVLIKDKLMIMRKEMLL